MKFQEKAFGYFFLVLFFGVPASLFATPIYYVYASGTAGAQSAGGDPQGNFGSSTLLQQTSYAPSPVALSSSGTFNNGISAASAAISGSITPAQLHGIVNATSGQGAPGFNAEGAASLTEYWDDTLTVGGLAVGTPVDVLVTFTFHTATSLTGVPSGTLYNQAYASSSLTVSDLKTGNSANIPTFTSSDSDPLFTQTASAILQTTVGSQLQWFQQMELVATASGDIIQSPLITANVDAGDTSSGYLNILTPGATLTAASGASYASATAPEPSTLLLFIPFLAYCLMVGIRTGAAQGRPRWLCSPMLKQLNFVLARLMIVLIASSPSMPGSQPGMPEPGVFHGSHDARCDHCTDAQSEVWVERLVGKGAYQFTADPQCAGQVSEEVTRLKQAGPIFVNQLFPGAGPYVGPLIDTATGKIVDQLRNANQGGEIGKLVDRYVGGPAECQILAAVIPGGAVTQDAWPRFLCGDGDRGWGAAVKDKNGQWNCEVGYAAWRELPQIKGPNGTIVPALFMNWSHDRARWAVMGVKYYFPEPPKQIRGKRTTAK